MYCYASPLKYVDPSGNDSYIITINPPNDTDINWDENAEAMKRQIEERYEGEIVHIIYISNEDELLNAWNEMGVGDQCGDYNNEKIVDSNISIVVINMHGYYNKVGYGDATPDTVLNDIIDKMDKKRVKGVILGGCNNGHTSYPDNVASHIAGLVNGAFVIASDGEVRVWSNDEETVFESIAGEQWLKQLTDAYDNTRQSEFTNYGWLVYEGKSEETEWSYIKEHCDIDEQYIQTMDFVEMLNALESKE